MGRSRFDSFGTHHQSRRLGGFDYTSAAGYFITICTHRRQQVFGHIERREMRLNKFGLIAEEEWQRSEEIRDEIMLDAHIIMPNHLHGIILFSPPEPSQGITMPSATPSHAAPPRRPPRSLGSFVAGYKGIVTKRINEIRRAPGAPVWQRNYHERIIRDRRHYEAARNYIRMNPAQWDGR